MANIITDNKYYTDIATAIRNKKGVTTKYKPSEMSAAINEIKTGSNVTIDGVNYDGDVNFVSEYTVKQLGDMTAKAQYPLATMVNDYVYFYYNVDSKLYKYNYSNNNSLGLANSPNHEIRAICYYDNEIQMICGGYGNYHYSFNINSKTFTQKANMPFTGGFCLNAMPLNDKLLVFGYLNYNNSGSQKCYTWKNNIWTQSTLTCGNINENVSLIHNNELYSFYDGALYKWSETARTMIADQIPLNSNYSAIWEVHTACSCPDGIHVFFGQKNDSNYTEINGHWILKDGSSTWENNDYFFDYINFDGSYAWYHNKKIFYCNTNNNNNHFALLNIYYDPS